ncbi:MAG: ABC transporter permease [Bryobacterales bacterium]|nr:ABC transporter permease [Bryobacterales bacterium]
MDRETLAKWLRMRRRPDEGLTEELDEHRMQLEEEYRARGLPDGEARRQAGLKLGTQPAVRERVRDESWLVAWENVWRDTRLGLRSLRRHPVFAIATVLTLALGIGANTLVFTLLYGLILRGLPVAAPERLARISVSMPDQPSSRLGLPYPMLRVLARESSSLEDVSGWATSNVAIKDAEGALRQEQAGLVTGNGFRLLGLRAYAGRLIEESDDRPGGGHGGWAMVLAHSFWRDRFGADPAVIGRSMQVYGEPVTVVGVAPREFTGLWAGNRPAAYLPAHFFNVQVGRDVLNTPGSYLYISAVGRLKPGVKLEQASAEMGAQQESWFREFFSSRERRPAVPGTRILVESARTGLPTFESNAYASPLALMQGLTGIVLLLCCVNVSGLMLVRVEQRQREFSIRTAIGAGRARLIRQYLTESLTIALAGAACGGWAAWYGVDWLAGFFRSPMSGYGLALQPDATVFGVTSALAIVAALTAGLYPAWRAGSTTAGDVLRSRTSFGRGGIIGRFFVPVQVALSLVLVTLAALLSQSLQRLRTEDPGFALDRVTIQTAPFHLLRVTGEAKLDLYDRMTERMERTRRIEAASFTWYTPMTGYQASAIFETGGGNSRQTLTYNNVGPGYFRTMGIKLVAGREFLRGERRDDICVINEAAAQKLFPGGGPAIGGFVTTADEKQFPQTLRCRVVGVAGSAKFAQLREPPQATVYYPIGTSTLPKAWNLVFLINAPNKAQAMAAYREALEELSPVTPLVLFATLREQMDAALGSERAVTTLCNVFGGLSLFLCAIGLYAMLSTSVARRTGEMGVRLALGAERGVVIRMVLSDAMRLVGSGLAAGVLGLVGVVGYAKSLLYGVSAFDPLTLTLCVLTILGVAAAAAIWPARRAAAVDPVVALRAE